MKLSGTISGLLSCIYKNCLFKSELETIIHHTLLVHSNDYNFQIKCCFQNCNKRFVNFKNNLRSSKNRNKDDPKSNSIKCGVQDCGINLTNIDELYKHYRSHFKQKTENNSSPLY